MTGLLLSPDRSAADDHVCLECRICWYVYDPAEGDAMDQIPAGTPFRKLPAHWRCPQCDASQDLFVKVNE